jgi:glycine betaine/proline transport system substrate-binding protein
MRRLTPRIRRPLLAGAGALMLLATGACALAERVTGAEPGPPVTIAVPDWPGGVANAAVVAHVLENELDVPVARVYLDQRRAWEALHAGDVQVMLEDWGAAPDLTELYVDRKESVVDAGPLGITGHVGWYVTADFARAHPDVLDWRHLNAYADDLGGRLLHADPAFATHDEALLDDLGLDLRAEAVGSEDALVADVRRAAASGEPLLTYLWEPHWLAAEVGLAEVELPGSSYPEITLRKYLNAEFAEEGGAVADFLRNFSWSAADQNAVAELIEGQGITPSAAAEQWVAEHPDTVASWLGG